MHRVTIRTEPARRLAAIHHQGAYPEIKSAFALAAATLEKWGDLGLAGPMVGVFLDNPDLVPEGARRSVAGFVVPEDLPIQPPLDEMLLPGGRHAVLRHVGPYDALADCYRVLFDKWFPASGEHPGRGDPFEVYLNSPMKTPAKDLVTEICVPLA
ncbi:GyrI-like domain-containing protein [Pseudoruegeria sp. SK021]|uniref:AraC family transcriptional regulator n=1 Tax=Pseudoruegeria sp. SK021 TaxID=1933035 RepID=UPI000A23BC14|nr:GyrI-like domain-containing protein [Pseudoruegeria sp. SK021]OSP55171.1 hypothetical protein BV911_09090 [Pseudoruegeria sp. SK021]